MTNIYFVTFGNEMYYNALIRIANQANMTKVFTKIKIYTDIQLKSYADFWDKHHEFISHNARGYGYWIWKPYIILKTLMEMDEGDILVYADAGCDILADHTTMKAYCELIKQCPTGMLSVALSGNIEKKWTKMDLFHHLDALHLLNTPQIHATFFGMRKCRRVVEMIEKWYETVCIYKLVDDTPSLLPNDEIFTEHRHDQSVFSLIRKLYGTDYGRIIPMRQCNNATLYSCCRKNVNQT